LLETINLHPEIKKELARIGDNIDEAVQAFFRIKDMSGKIVDFMYNRAQLLHQSRESKFDFVLKARKVGISSRRFARDILMCATHPHQHRIMLAQTDDDKNKLFSEKIKPLIDNCRLPFGCIQKNDYLEFPATNSKYYVGTAGSKKFGRGSDITGYHFPEYAHWSKPDVVAGVEEGLVDGADGLIETTANGHNFAKIDWDKAKRGGSKYKAIFLPWFVNESYVRPSAEIQSLSETDARLMRDLGVTLEQIAWRQWKLRNMRDPSLFPQEYPESDQEAFLSSGRPVFDWISLLQAKKNVSESLRKGYLHRTHDSINLSLSDHGNLKVWEVPEPYPVPHVYVIGADIAEGIENGAYSTAEVLDVGTGVQVAEWHGHIAPDLFAEVLIHLSEYYHHAVIIPEAWPGPGGITTQVLLDRRAKVWQSPEKDRIGWETTSASKPLMISSFAAAIRDLAITIRSPELLEECHSFVYDPKGHMVPSSGNFSDRVMGMAIAWYCSRDLASRTNYYRPSAITDPMNSLRGGTSVSKFSGPRLGVRRE
jgi:hypothetical protein